MTKLNKSDRAILKTAKKALEACIKGNHKGLIKAWSLLIERILSKDGFKFKNRVNVITLKNIKIAIVSKDEICKVKAVISKLDKYRKTIHRHTFKYEKICDFRGNIP